MGANGRARPSREAAEHNQGHVDLPLKTKFVSAKAALTWCESQSSGLGMHWTRSVLRRALIQVDKVFSVASADDNAPAAAAAAAAAAAEKGGTASTWNYPDEAGGRPLLTCRPRVHVCARNLFARRRGFTST